MTYTAVYISGNLIAHELIDRLDDDSHSGQRPADFGLETGIRTRQDIARAWTDANDYWKIFKRKLDALKENERGTTETRSQWMIPLLGLLGYELNYIQQPETVNEKPYDISHRATNRDALPVMVVSAKEGLDTKPEGSTRHRMSPHALLQEYLNVTEHTYGLVTNGKLLRLLRDNGRITRLTYLEFNLEKIFEEDLYADFALLYRLLHISRMPLSQAQVADSIIETYYRQAIEAGTRIRESLSGAVEAAIKLLGTGLLQHPDNAQLRQLLQNGQLNHHEFYQHLLRLVYRLLFVMTIEERRLVYPENLTPEQQRSSERYYQYYSLQRLRNLAGKKHLVQAKHHHLYIQLWQNFQLLEKQGYATHLHLQALGSGLFAPGNLQTLQQCRLYNKDLLRALWHLSYFTDAASGQTIRVNYGALNVEEFGSVYEGLLDYQAQVTENSGQWQFTLVKSQERGKSGSHYTPEELVQPLIKHSLDYLIADCLKTPDPENALLALTVCDVACGSGHILLSAARRIALEVARYKYKEEQPSPEHLRRATRSVINHCIYGVDKNPMAVELCKVALWLEAHSPGEPLNFLDHHIKCGDAIVGLAHRQELDKGIADEAFKTLPGDDKETTAALLKRNRQEREQQAQATFDFDATAAAELTAVLQEYQLFNNLPERSPEEVEQREKQYRAYEDNYHRIRIKQLADAQVAQFFIPKTTTNQPQLLTNAEYRSFLRQVNSHLGILQSHKLAKAEIIAKEKGFFHWFLEFPEVMDKGGFDCVLGNPPYLGGTKISTFNGDNYFNFCKLNYAPAAGRCDLVGYFVRRIFFIQKENGFHSIITTKTIAEGDTREGGFDIVLKEGGRIVYAEKGVVWPGKANVIVTLYSLVKGNWSKGYFLSKKQVNHITAYLTEDSFLTTPFLLKNNEKKAFMGSSITGDGFLIANSVFENMIKQDVMYNEVIFRYVNGSDFNNMPNHLTDKRIINFADNDLSFVKTKYPIALDIVENLVKPEREKKSIEVSSAPWWKYWRIREELYNAISNNKKVLILTRATSTHGFSFLKNDKYVFSDAVIVFKDESFSTYSLIQSSLHEDWAWRFSSKIKNDRRYSVTDAFETFPFPQNITPAQKAALEQIGQQYHEHRRQLMLAMQLGLTKTYNAFHAREVQPGLSSQALEGLDKKAIEKQFGKEVGNLWQHLQKTAGACTWEAALTGIAELRALHVQMDQTVMEAYGWTDIALLHDYYEVDYLPENDRIRFTIHPDARREVLRRLLALNHQLHEAEVAAGLWDKKQAGGAAKKTARLQPQNQLSLLSTDQFTMKEWGLHDGIYSIQDCAHISDIPEEKVRRWFKGLYDERYEGFGNQQTGDHTKLRISFHGLIELVVIGALRDVNISFAKILNARNELKKFTGKEYPFATNNVNKSLKVAGRTITFNLPEGIINLDGSEQFNFEFIVAFFKDIVYQNDIAQRMIPAKGKGKIVIDPKEANGKPAIINKEIPVDSIMQFYNGPSSIMQIQQQFDISEEEIAAAIEYSN